MAARKQNRKRGVEPVAPNQKAEVTTGWGFAGHLSSKLTKRQLFALALVGIPAIAVAAFLFLKQEAKPQPTETITTTPDNTNEASGPGSVAVRDVEGNVDVRINPDPNQAEVDRKQLLQKARQLFLQAEETLVDLTKLAQLTDDPIRIDRARALINEGLRLSSNDWRGWAVKCILLKIEFMAFVRSGDPRFALAKAQEMISLGHNAITQADASAKEAEDIVPAYNLRNIVAGGLIEVSNLTRSTRQENARKAADYIFAIPADKRDAHAWANLGQATSIMRMHTESIKACRSAVELNASIDQAWLGLVFEYAELGRPDESERVAKTISKVLETEPYAVARVLVKARNRVSRNQPQEAIATITQAGLAVEPDISHHNWVGSLDDSAHYFLALAFAQAGDNQQARHRTALCLCVDPSDPAFLQLAKQLNMRPTDKELALVAKAIGIAQDSHQFLPSLRE